MATNKRMDLMGRYFTLSTDVNHGGHGGHEAIFSGCAGAYLTTRLIPSFNTFWLKFINRPTRKPVIRRYVSNCAVNTGSIRRTLLISTTTVFSTIRSGRYSPITVPRYSNGQTRWRSH